MLEPPFPPAVARSQPGTLRVGTTVIAAPYRSRAFVFRETDLKYETDYYHEFLVAPSANIGEVTARALAGAKVFAAVAPSGVLADADWVLESFVNALYGDIREKDKPAVVLSITYFLRRGDSDAGGARLVEDVRPAGAVRDRQRCRLRDCAQYRVRRRSWPNSRATSRPRRCRRGSTARERAVRAV